MTDDKRLTKIELALHKAACDRYIIGQALGLILAGQFAGNEPDSIVGKAAEQLMFKLERIGELPPPPPPTGTGSGGAMGLVAAAERSNRAHRRQPPPACSDVDPDEITLTGEELEELRIMGDIGKYAKQLAAGTAILVVGPDGVRRVVDVRTHNDVELEP